MTPQRLVWQASLAWIDLNVRDGQLYARSGDGPIPASLIAAIRDQKPAILHVLTVWPHMATLREDVLDRCRPLTPDDLTATERLTAETLAAELKETGGLGQFVIDIMYFWNDLKERERLQVAWCWDTAVASEGASVAA